AWTRLESPLPDAQQRLWCGETLPALQPPNRNWNSHLFATCPAGRVSYFTFALLQCPVGSEAAQASVQRRATRATVTSPSKTTLTGRSRSGSHPTTMPTAAPPITSCSPEAATVGNAVGRDGRSLWCAISTGIPSAGAVPMSERSSVSATPALIRATQRACASLTGMWRESWYATIRLGASKCRCRSGTRAAGTLGGLCSPPAVRTRGDGTGPRLS
ncbi:hypothetical protein DFJ73DRAFT_309897, partial [Zopfochytrium polystomum]